MKARLLKKLLNNTGYIVSNRSEHIAVGSPLVSDLIAVNKETFKVKYALDTFREGRKALDGELLFIWDKLHELINTGQIHELLNGKDEIANPLPVFTVEDGKLVESITDEYGWPNTDDNGILMYNNTHFPTKQQAIQYGINEYKAREAMILDRIQDIEKDLSSAKQGLEKYRKYINYLEEVQGNK